jgi:MutS domain III
MSEANGRMHSSSDGDVAPAAPSRDGDIYGGSSLFGAAVPFGSDASDHSRRRSRNADDSSSFLAQNRRDVHSSGAPPMEPPMAVMSVVVEGSNIAFCCYQEEQNEIVIENCQAITGYETEAMVDRFLQVVRPTMVLVGNNIVKNTPLLQMVTKPPTPLPGEERETDDGDDPPEKEANTDPKKPGTQNGAIMPGAREDDSHFLAGSSSIPYCVLKSKSFDLRACQSLILHKLRVLSLLPRQGEDRTTNHRTTGMFQDPDRESRRFPLASSDEDVLYRPSSFHHLAAVIDFDSKVLVQALGALISHLQSRVFLLDEGGLVSVNRIVQASTSPYMKISATTFSALHIFATEHHPLIAKGPGNAKEGFSLYSLMDRTNSKGGRQLLREWMLKPLIDLEAITTRQDTVERLLQPTLETVVGILNTQLKRVGPIDKILLRIQKCTSKPQDFLILKTTLSAAISIGQVLRDNVLSLIDARPGMSTELCYRYLSTLQAQCNLEVLMSLRECISVTIDEESTLGSAIVIRYGFDEELDKWKEQYECLEDDLQLVARDLHRRHPQLPGLSVLFLAQVGYLVALNKELVVHNPVQLPPDFERIFSQDEDGRFLKVVGAVLLF